MRHAFTDVFTTNENTTDGEILDRIYEIVEKEDMSDTRKIRIIIGFLEYAREEN